MRPCSAVLLFALLLGAVAEAEPTPLLRLETEAVRRAAEAVSPRVVRVRRFGASDEGVLATGSPLTGLLLDERGWIVTSLYGLLADPEKIIVEYADGGSAVVELVARDHPRQVTLLKAPAREVGGEGLVAGKPTVGQRAIAVGWTLADGRPNLTLGVVSAVGRLSGRALQTDAAASPANYGGPLLSLDGSVLGVLTPLSPAGQAGVDWYDAGIGFAVPLQEIEHRLERLKRGGDIRAGWLGVKLSEGAPLWVAPRIEEVVAGSPAERAGLAPGDRIVSVGGLATPTRHAFEQRIGGKDAGEVCPLEVRRDGKRFEIEAALTPAPSVKQ